MSTDKPTAQELRIKADNLRTYALSCKPGSNEYNEAMDLLRDVSDEWLAALAKERGYRRVV